MNDEKTTISVTEMRRRLGIKKTDSYWLVQQGYFETVIIKGKMRVVLASFEKWYANQLRHKKANGAPPGEEIRNNAYSMQDVAEILSVTVSSVLYAFHRDNVDLFEKDFRFWIKKDVFQQWYVNQNRLRTREDAEKDTAAIEISISMPEMARLLGISREQVYQIMKEQRKSFDWITVAGRQRMTKESFEKWYQNQTKYHAQEPIGINKPKKEPEEQPVTVDPNKSSFSTQEVLVLLNLDRREVMDLIRRGELAAKKYGNKYMIRRDEIIWWLRQQERTK